MGNVLILDFLNKLIKILLLENYNNAEYKFDNISN